MEFQMRNKTFISSMVGIATAMAFVAAGSASAGFVDGLTTSFATTAITTNFGSSTVTSTLPTTGPDACLFNTRDASAYYKGTLASSTGSGSASMTVAARVASSVVLSYRNLDASSPNLSSTPGFSVNVASWSGYVLTFELGLYDSAGNQLGINDIVVSGNGMVTFDKAAFVPTAGPINWSAIGQVQLVMATTSLQTGPTTFTIDSFTNTVPAPGALALLGVAGIVGGRRRRA
jgi:MYXO-CTERM domain-containing protein